MVEGVLVGGCRGCMGQEGRRLSLQYRVAKGQWRGVGAAQRACTAGPHLQHTQIVKMVVLTLSESALAR